MFCLCFLSNSLPLRVLPLIQEGELFYLLFNMLIKLLLLDKRTLRNKQCLLYAKLGCARLQLQASSHCTRWHELCDANQKRQFLKTEGFSSRRIFSCFACVFGQTPSPVGYSLLSKRESIYYLKF